MAVAVGRHKRAVPSGIRMNFLFFLMSVVVLIVMGISMWKDTHPQWLAYQTKFAGLERSVLIAKRTELLRELGHPDYLGDYKTALKNYTDVKAKYDTATSALEDTEASLEELEIRSRAGSDEEGGASPVKLAGAATTAASAKADKSELNELDQEFSKGGDKKPATAAAPSKAAAPSGKELSDLDKEFADSSKSKGAPKPQPAKAAPKSSGDEMADLDKDFAAAGNKKSAVQPAAPAGQTKPAATGSGAEMSDLDKEFSSSDKSKTSTSHGSKVAAPAASSESDFPEADFQVDQPGARDRLQAAERDLLIAQRTHEKEMIGLPEDAALKREHAEDLLTEATQTLAVAQADVELEAAKAIVKSAAQAARWAADTATLTSLQTSGRLEAEPAEHVKQLQDSSTKLSAHIADLKRDLRLVEGQISRNKKQGPEVEQVFVDRLGAIDRCTTCHLAVEQKGFENSPEPFHTHSAELLKFHPIDRFGCVSCHGGFGNALNKDEAHGDVIGKGKPLLVGDQVQASCGKCHGETRQLSGESTYLAGAQLFKNSGCLGCHKVDLSQPSAITGATKLVLQTNMPKAGPDLDRVSEKVKPAWLVGWLQNPQSHSLDARMPNLGLQRTQAAAIATFLLTQHGQPNPAATSQPLTFNEQRLAKGKLLTQNLGCLGCHTVRGEGASIGPELTNIRSKVGAQWLYAWIENPKAFFPNSKMPVFNLSKEQCAQIGDYLLSVGDGKPAPNDFEPNLNDAKARELGSKLIAERGCAGCHDMKGFDRISAPELTHEGDKTADVLEFGNSKGVKRDLYDYLLTKITDPRSFDTDKFKGKMPKFGLDKEDARTIAIYLMSLSSQELPPEYTRDLQEQGSPLVAGRAVFTNHDCASCHRLAGVGGKIGPDLTREGEMVRPSWMFPFLKSPIRIRWWQDARMPNYSLTDTEATNLTEYFMAISNQPAPYEYTPPDQKVFPLAGLGAKYFVDLKCQSCHPLAGKQGVAGGDTKKLGPDLGLAPTRLKKDWMLRFLRDPQAFSPGTQMPTFGKPDDQYMAIIDFLMKQKSP